MRPRSLRTSLLWWFVATTTSLLVATSTVLWFGVRASLLDGLDAELHARAEAIAAMCEWEDGEIELEGAGAYGALSASLDPERSIEIRRLPGLAPIAHWGPPLSEPSEQGGSGARFTELESTRSGAAPGPRMRICTLRIDVASTAASSEPSRPPATVQVRVTASLAPLHERLRRIGWFLSLVGLASLALVVGFGLFLSRRLTLPLAKLGEAAAAVRPGEAHALPDRGTGDEVDRLATILDRAFGELRSAMERQKDFTANASHELRNPATIVRTQAEVALRRTRTPAEYQSTLDEIRATALRMGEILESLLMLARLDAHGVPTDEQVDLAVLAREATKAGASPIMLEVRSPDTAIVHGNRGLLRILLDNLITNARSHAANSALVSVEIAARGERLELAVSDDGPGIPDPEREHVFARFYRGKRSEGRPGAGLGLALVDTIARAHGARCRIDDVARGTRIVVSFPATTGGAGRTVSGQGFVLPISGSR